MPDLNIKGNALEDFGAYLPTPIINRINIYDDKLEVDIAIYFNFIDPEATSADLSEYMTSMGASSIYVYVARVLGKEFINNLISAENTDIFTELYRANPDAACFKSLARANTDPVQDLKANFVQLQLNTSNFILSDKNFYDDQGNRIIQYTATVVLPILFEGNGGASQFTLADVDHLNLFHVISPRELGELAIFAFTSIMDLDSDSDPLFIAANSGDNSNSTPTDPQPRYIEFNRLNLMPQLVKQMVSNVAYEPVFKEGVPDITPRLAYVDSNGGTYNNTPIQAIDGKLYKQDGYSLEQIVALFKTYTSENKTDDSNVQNILDNISYILSTYGTSSELLIQLNIMRKSFSSKSTATPVGRLYSGFKGRFFGANEKVAGGTPLTEQLYKSTKIKVLTGTARNAFHLAGESQNPSSHNFIYSYKEGMQTNVARGDWMSSVEIYTEGAYGNPTKDEFIKSGFWFFDYRQALKQHAQICSLFQLSHIKYLINEYELQKYFLLTEVEMQKYECITEDNPNKLEDFPTAITNYKLRWTMTEPIRYRQDNVEEYNHDGFQSQLLAPYINARGMGYGALDVANGVDVDTDPAKTWIIIRGVQGTLINDDHRLVCFEFQDTEPWPGYVGGDASIYDFPDDKSFYTFKVTLEDTTYLILQDIKDSFVDYYNNEFTEYYHLANENCNYNQQDGTFNGFFTEGVLGHYGDDESQYPWMRMPVLFKIHSLLLAYGLAKPFGGDDATFTEAMEAAAAIASSINPVNGNIESLNAFYQRCQDLIDSNYSTGKPMDLLIKAGPQLPAVVIQGRDANPYLWTAPPPPLSTIEEAWSPYMAPEEEVEEEEVEEEDDTTTEYTWTKDSAYASLKYGWNYRKSLDYSKLLVKIMKKWDWHRDLIDDYESGTKGWWLAIDDWITKSDNSAKKAVIDAANDWAEAHDALDNNTGYQGIAVLKYKPGYIYDGEFDRYQVAVKNVDDPDAFDTIRVYRWFKSIK